MEQIVVGFVDVETARAAAAQAASLAVDLKAALHVVTALEDPNVEEVNVGPETFRIDDFEIAERAVHEFMRSLDEQPSYTVAVSRGKPADAILAEAERLDADLIVVGNVRMQGPGRVFGSVANKVAHNAPCNVMICKTV